MNNEIKIVLIGSGGDGIKFLGKSLGKYLIALGYEIALTFSYDSAVRGGEITASLIFGKNKIESPVIDNADFILDFKKEKITNMEAFGLLIKELKLEFNEQEIANVLPENSKEKNIKEIKKGYEK